METPKYHNPYNGNPQKGTPNMGKQTFRVSGLGPPDPRTTTTKPYQKDLDGYEYHCEDCLVEHTQ